MKNIAIKALDPVLNKINALANNQQVQEMFNMFINGASLAAQAILNLIEGISWLLSVLEPVAPVILGLVGAYVGFNIVSMIASGLLGMLSIAHGIAGAAEMLHSGQTMAATAAQWGLNSALLACPITWIVILIMALIVALTYLWFTNDKVAYGILYVCWTWNSRCILCDSFRCYGIMVRNSNLCTWGNGCLVCFSNRSRGCLFRCFKHLSRFIQWGCLVSKPE